MRVKAELGLKAEQKPFKGDFGMAWVHLLKVTLAQKKASANARIGLLGLAHLSKSG